MCALFIDLNGVFVAIDDKENLKMWDGTQDEDSSYVSKSHMKEWGRWSTLRGSEV